MFVIDLINSSHGHEDSVAVGNIFKPRIHPQVRRMPRPMLTVPRSKDCSRAAITKDYMGLSHSHEGSVAVGDTLQPEIHPRVLLCPVQAIWGGEDKAVVSYSNEGAVAVSYVPQRAGNADPVYRGFAFATQFLSASSQ